MGDLVSATTTQTKTPFEKRPPKLCRFRTRREDRWTWSNGGLSTRRSAIKCEFPDQRFRNHAAHKFLAFSSFKTRTELFINEVVKLFNRDYKEKDECKHLDNLQVRKHTKKYLANIWKQKQQGGSPGLKRQITTKNLRMNRRKDLVSLITTFLSYFFSYSHLTCPQAFKARKAALESPHHPLEECCEWPYFQKAFGLEISMPEYNSGTKIEGAVTARYCKNLRAAGGNDRPPISKRSCTL